MGQGLREAASIRGKWLCEHALHLPFPSGTKVCSLSSPLPCRMPLQAPFLLLGAHPPLCQDANAKRVGDAQGGLITLVPSGLKVLPGPPSTWSTGDHGNRYSRSASWLCWSLSTIKKTFMSLTVSFHLLQGFHQWYVQGALFTVNSSWPTGDGWQRWVLLFLTLLLRETLHVPGHPGKKQDSFVPVPRLREAEKRSQDLTYCLQRALHLLSVSLQPRHPASSGFPLSSSLQTSHWVLGWKGDTSIHFFLFVVRITLF